MFTLLSHIIGYFIPEDNCGTESELNQWKPFIGNNYPFLFSINEESQIQTVDGKVTHVFHGHGLINGNIYFSSTTVQGNEDLEVGDDVLVKAVRYNQNGGWYATSITVINQTWEKEDVNCTDFNILNNNVVVGKITSIKDGVGKINDSFDFDIKSCKEGYLPMQGDWVSAYVQESRGKKQSDLEEEWNSTSEKKIALSITPTRQSTINGTVTAIRDNHGYINEEIFFDRSVCRNGFWPQRNAAVQVIAIESTVGKRCDWRAISIVPLSASNSNRYNQKQNIPKEVSKWYFPGQRPKRFQPPVQLPIKLPHFTVPEKIFRAVIDGDELSALFPCLAQELSFQNYSSRMATLLYLEEIQNHLDIQEFNMCRVVFKVMGEYLALTVPGLAEGRPSLLIGDKIIITSPSEPEGPHYEGFIHEMTNSEVLLKFYPEFHSKYNGKDFDVAFTFRRTSIRRCHQAVSLAIQYLSSKVLFPCEVKLTQPQVDLENLKDEKLHYFNKLLNSRQKTAIKMILKGHCRPTPYIIFGPPGTGKTVTVVEAILQIYSHIPSSRIVVCTPSNSAADLITERLHHSCVLEQTHLVRLSAHQRPLDNIPEDILKYCRFADDLNLISRYRVIVSTCTMIGGMYGLGVRSGHFTHIFVDESGQATEPECLIPMGLIAGNQSGQIILAGDPKQLGPVIMSSLAKMYSLEISLLERLMNRDVYKRDKNDEFDSNFVTMLIFNYRSHPAILALPSKLFYYDQLKSMADHNVTHKLINCVLLPKTDFPVIFHEVFGEDMKEKNSPSWFNPGEIIQVVQYLQGVLRENISPSDIGVITPYKKQVEKIRLMIESLGMPEIKVGSVEEFQGQEYQVIILSCVRSNKKLIGSDVRHCLGFLSNPKRLNVSITRAISLLVIVGNPDVLSQDPHWRQLVLYCKNSKGYVQSDRTVQEM